MATSLINTECKRYGCIKNLLACYANCRYNSRCEELRNEISDKTETASSDINKYLSERGRAPITIQLMKRGLKFANAVKPDSRSDKGEKLVSRIKSQVVQIPSVGMEVRAATKAERVLADGPSRLTKKRIRKSINRSLEPVMARPFKLRDAKIENKIVKSVKPPGAHYEDKPPTPRRKKKGSKRRKQIIKAKKRPAGEVDSLNKLATVLTKNRKSAAMLRRPKKELNPVVAEKGQVSNPPLQAQESNANQKTKVSKPARSKKGNSRSGSRNGDKNEKLYIILEGKSASVVNEQTLMAHLFTNPSSGARYFEASEVEARVHIVKK